VAVILTVITLFKVTGYTVILIPVHVLFCISDVN